MSTTVSVELHGRPIGESLGGTLCHLGGDEPDADDRTRTEFLGLALHPEDGLLAASLIGVV